MVALHKRKDYTPYIILIFILLFGVLLVYYAFTAGPQKNISAGVLSYSLASIQPNVYSIGIENVSAVYNQSYNELFIEVKIINDGNSTIGFDSGCVSAFTGKVSPESIANLTYVKNVATCNVIAIQSLAPNKTADLTWPYYPQTISIYQTGNFNVNLTFPFGFYTKIYPPCAVSNSSCISNSSRFAGFSEYASIDISLQKVSRKPTI